MSSRVKPSLLLTAALLTTTACGSSTPEAKPELPCSKDYCGDPLKRRAIPTASLLTIGGGKQRTAAHRLWSLASVSPALTETEAYIDDINDEIVDVLEEFSDIADNAPEIDEPGLSVWRGPIANGDEAILRIESADNRAYDLTYELGDPGFAPGTGVVFISGELSFADDDELQADSFDLTFDYSEVEDVTLNSITGTLRIAGKPFGADGLEIWYDFADYSENNEPAETSRTTYWELDDSGDRVALEFVADFADGEDTTVFVQWDDNGGRWDHVANYTDDGLDIEEIHTDCWSGSGAQVFEATAWFSSEFDEAYLEGEEADCAFGPLESHPSPSDEFDRLPGEGEWDSIDVEWIDCDAEPAACEP